MEDYTKQMLRIVVAQVCQAIGWHTIQSTPLELLTDILHKYMQELSVRTFRYTQLYSRIDANLDDVGLAFRDLTINIHDLLEYINNVDSVPCTVDVPRYPVRKESSLNFLKPGSKEVITRPVHIHEYLPPIHPEKEEESSPPQSEQSTSVPNPINNGMIVDPSTVITDITNTTANNININNNTTKAIFKKPDTSDVSSLTYKKARYINEEEGRPTREISSVMMTSSGFISPAREGKLPDSKVPIIPEYKPPRPVTPPYTPILPNTLAPATAAATTTIGSTLSPGTLAGAAAPSLSSTQPALVAQKPEKKSRRQKNTAASGNNNNVVHQAKEQRRRDRHLAKLQKRKIDQLPPVATTKTTGAKKPRARDSKNKRSMIIASCSAVVSSSTAAAATSSPSIIDVLPSVTLPADLTIKSETVPVSSIFSGGNAFNITNNSPSTANNNVTTTTSVVDKITNDEIKITSEPDKQKYSIFKKISSKKSRDDPQKMSSADLYSGLPTLPESTTIHRVPASKFDSPPHTDPNIIVVDDDTPPRLSSPLPLAMTGPAQLLPLPNLPAGTTATSSFPSSFFDCSFMNMRQPNNTSSSSLESPAVVKKQQRRPRKNKQQPLVEQSAPLNLSHETTSIPKNLQMLNANHNQPTTIVTKPPRKRPNKVGRPSKRATAAANKMSTNIVPTGSHGGFHPVVPPITSESLKRDDITSHLNMFKASNSQFLSGVHRYPLITPFHLLGGPGLIPNPNFMHPSGNPLLNFRNPFGYNDFMGLRPPIRTAKIDDVTSVSPTTPPLPLDLESTVYCNVPPLVPDSLKLQLSPGLISSTRGSKLSSTGATISSSGSSYMSLKNLNSKMDSQNLSIFPTSITSTTLEKSPRNLDVPIEISDDEKSVTKSDTESEHRTTTITPSDIGNVSSCRASDALSTIPSTENPSNPPYQQSPIHHHSLNSQRIATEINSEVINADHNNEASSIANQRSDVSDEIPVNVKDVATVAGATINPSSITQLTKAEKKREKEHKKGKRGKDGKIKKKKDKKDKVKNKEKADKRKDEKKEKDRTKKKKEKRKEKLKSQFNDMDDPKQSSTTNDAQIPLTDPNVMPSSSSTTTAATGSGGAAATISSTTVPKLTLKFGSPRSSAGDDLPETKKLNNRHANGSDEIIEGSGLGIDERRESSPELARISPLVTRPPKQKSFTKEKGSGNGSGDIEQSIITSSSSSSLCHTYANVAAVTTTTRGPGRPPKNPITAAAAISSSSIATTALSGLASSNVIFSSSTLASHDSGNVTSSSDTKTNSTFSSTERAAAGGPTSSSTTTSSTSSSSAGNIGLRSGNKATGNASSSAKQQATSSSSEPIDAEGNQVWICPACGRVDDGTPMIGCDGCDAWYHWVCVGIQVPPDEREDWYCRNCIIKKQEANYYDKKKKRKKKNKVV